MSKKLFLPLAALLLLALGGAALAGEHGMPLKAGDKVFICNCGEKCDCGFVSKKAGKCGCGHDAVEATVTQVEDDSFTCTVAGKERTLSKYGKYVCGCGPSCDCFTTSNKPGKCSCGMELKPAAH